MDKVSFFGYTIPPEIKAMIPLLGKLESPNQTKEIMSMAATYIITKKINTNKQTVTQLKETTDSIQLKLEKKANNAEDRNQLSIIFTGCYYLLKLAIKKRVTTQTFTNDLNDLKLPQAFINDISALYTSQYKDFIEKTNNDKILFHQLVNFKWRVDVVISSSFTSRVMIPVILMEMTDNFGQQKTFEVSLDIFHKLRYNVSKVLKDMEDLEQIQILSKFDK
ncbi:COMM domain-containing protein 5 [Tieghemostelium lacteum]|uniref:COMM domain-containing protein 5 n=1 Tax=Tieghemostelium lacteum TaxID=361077 RepID=A0A151ZFK3_TIELA|nr:COMM domain-containing protein 5 [Tieghemostelium lacteum]|eukprot:KYQ92644.1 COMM domain-containing protein 5 [Tieghemostelium lacteum]